MQKQCKIEDLMQRQLICNSRTKTLKIVQKKWEKWFFKSLKIIGQEAITDANINKNWKWNCQIW